MARTVTHTYRGFDMPDVLVDLDGHEHSGELRAWAVDDDEWFGLVQYRIRPGHQMLGWLPAGQVRRDGGLTDEDGLVATNVVPFPQRDT